GLGLLARRVRRLIALYVLGGSADHDLSRACLAAWRIDQDIDDKRASSRSSDRASSAAAMVSCGGSMACWGRSTLASASTFPRSLDQLARIDRQLADTLAGQLE